MTTSATSAGTAIARPTSFGNVACPFCGLLCDDLSIDASQALPRVTAAHCPRGKAGFERVRPLASPSIGGQPVGFDAAVAEAARLIKASRKPLFGGLATDVEGMRAIMELTETAHGIVDHAAGSIIQRNMTILQSRGWVMSTLTETRNRADLIILLGTTLKDVNPGFWSRIGSPAEAMFLTPAQKRTVVLIGEGLDAADITGQRIGEVVSIACPADRIGDVLAALRARLKGAEITEAALGGLSAADIDGLAQRIAKAAYGIVAWAPGALADSHADVTIERATELVKDLSKTQRVAGLSLGGSEGAVTAASVCAWQSGYPLRVSYETGAPVYDPYRNAIDRCLADGEGDLLVWTASISPDLVPPATDLPMIVLGTPGLALASQPAVFIPVGTPGLDHKGRMIRVDSVVALPLKQIVDSGLPRVADVASAIRAAL